MKNVRLFVAIVGPLALILAGCGGASGESGGSGDMTVSIMEPAENASVTAPFTVKVTPSVPIGTTDTGRHHVHVWFDENDTEYVIGYTDTVTVDRAPAGQHWLVVSLRNADHSPAGAQARVMVTVGGGAGGAPPPTTGGGYDY